MKKLTKFNVIFDLFTICVYFIEECGHEAKTV